MSVKSFKATFSLVTIFTPLYLMRREALSCETSCKYTDLVTGELEILSRNEYPVKIIEKLSIPVLMTKTLKQNRML